MLRFARDCVWREMVTVCISAEPMVLVVPGVECILGRKKKNAARSKAKIVHLFFSIKTHPYRAYLG